MKEQTAVEWLIEQWPILESQIPERILEQAKEMEKEQISIAYKEGWNCPHGEGFPETGEQYYNETYESKTNI
jgi:hypothetical protein